MSYTITQDTTVVTLNNPINLGRKHSDDIQMHYWRDETYGSEYFGNVGDTLKIIGEERSPPCLEFDGAVDKIDLDTGHTTSTAFTFCFWGYSVNWSTQRGMAGDEVSYNNGRLSIQTATLVDMRTTVGANGITLTKSLPTGKWMHIALTRDASNYGKFYLNGENITSGSPTASGTISFDRLFDNPNDSAWKAWYGKVRDARLFTDAKSVADIQSIMAGNEITTALEGWWKFNYRDPDATSAIYDETGDHDGEKDDPDWLGTMIDLHTLESLQGEEITLAGLADTNLNGAYLIRKVRARAESGKIYCYQYDLTLERV